MCDQLTEMRRKNVNKECRRRPHAKFCAWEPCNYFNTYELVNRKTNHNGFWCTLFRQPTVGAAANATRVMESGHKYYVANSWGYTRHHPESRVLPGPAYNGYDSKMPSEVHFENFVPLKFNTKLSDEATPPMGAVQHDHPDVVVVHESTLSMDPESTPEPMTVIEEPENEDYTEIVVEESPTPIIMPPTVTAVSTTTTTEDHTTTTTATEYRSIVVPTTIATTEHDTVHEVETVTKTTTEHDAHYYPTTITRTVYATTTLWKYMYVTNWGYQYVPVPTTTTQYLVFTAYERIRPTPTSTSTTTEVVVVESSTATPTTTPAPSRKYYLSTRTRYRVKTIVHMHQHKQEEP